MNQILLLRVPDGPTEELVAFTAICPHAAGLVSEWVAQTCRLHCPCHGSEYDPAKAGMVVAGLSAATVADADHAGCGRVGDRRRPVLGPAPRPFEPNHSRNDGNLSFSFVLIPLTSV